VSKAMQRDFSSRTIYVFRGTDSGSFEWSDYEVPGSTAVLLTYDKWVNLHALESAWLRQQYQFKKIVEEASND
jgi:hypothetical protein